MCKSPAEHLPLCLLPAAIALHFALPLELNHPFLAEHGKHLLPSRVILVVLALVEYLLLVLAHRHVPAVLLALIETEQSRPHWRQLGQLLAHPQGLSDVKLVLKQRTVDLLHVLLRQKVLEVLLVLAEVGLEVATR